MNSRLGLTLALVLTAALALFAERTLGAGSLFREAAQVAARDSVAQFLSSHVQVLTALARQFQEWDAFVPDPLERSLRVFGERFPALRRLLVADHEGRVVAAFDTGARVGAERSLTGALDPSALRRAALRTQLLPYRRTVAGAEAHLELGAPIMSAEGTLRGYLAADLELGSLCEQLQRLEATGVRVGLDDGSGNALCGFGRRLLASRDRVEIKGVWLVVREPWWRTTAPLGVVLGALALLIASSMRRRIK